MFLKAQARTEVGVNKDDGEDEGNNKEVGLASTPGWTNTATGASSALQGGCSVCGKPNAQVCTGCKREMYCSVICQRKAWKLHKRTCCRKSRSK